jgi:hypothetical protein
MTPIESLVGALIVMVVMVAACFCFTGPSTSLRSWFRGDIDRPPTSVGQGLFLASLAAFWFVFKSHVLHHDSAAPGRTRPAVAASRAASPAAPHSALEPYRESRRP